MKLYASFSEAIREGAKLRPRQCFFKMYEVNASCAQGAALEAILERPATVADWSDESLIMMIRTNYSRELNRRIPPPCGCDAILRVDRLIVHLNNAHKWSRERIADWLFREEEKLGYVTLTTEKDVSIQSQTGSIVSPSGARTEEEWAYERI